jgi:hypothetical protein
MAVGGRPPEASVLDFSPVREDRASFVGKRSIVTVAGAALIPMLPVIAIEVPIKDQLLSVFKVLL